MLTSEDIKEGALYISTTKDEWFELMDFFYKQKKLFKTPEECYPVILVVDEVSVHLQYFNMPLHFQCHSVAVTIL